MFRPDSLLWQAIERRRLIRLVYHGKERLVEPHDHGVLNSSLQLLGYQVAGLSSRPLPNWILMKVDDMEDLHMLGKHICGRTAHRLRQTSPVGHPIHPSPPRRLNPFKSTTAKNAGSR